MRKLFLVIGLHGATIATEKYIKIYCHNYYVCMAFFQCKSLCMCNLGSQLFNQFLRNKIANPEMHFLVDSLQRPDVVTKGM